MHIGKEDFTIEAHMKKPRRVYRWRGKKFIVRDPWQHVAVVFCQGVTKRYVNGVEVMSKVELEKMPFKSMVIDELRVSKIARDETTLIFHQKGLGNANR